MKHNLILATAPGKAGNWISQWEAHWRSHGTHVDPTMIVAGIVILALLAFAASRGRRQPA